MHKKKVILIRHGEAASTWDGDDRDPSLSKKGVEQAKSINDFTKSIFSKRYDFVSSPKKRAIETLNYASGDIDVNFDINEGFVEIPAEDIDSNIRFEWLKDISTRKIETLPDDIKNWRERIITETLNLKNNSIIFCHFMVINVLVGYAIKKDRLLHFYPDNASITEIEVENEKISVISMKDVEKTIINV
jgi:probable phosphoglycerate mutase